MRTLRSWLVSLLLATLFATGVVAIALAEPASMLAEEDVHTEDGDPEVDASSIPAPGASSPVPATGRAARGVSSASHRGATRAPTREHRVDVHRPPAA